MTDTSRIAPVPPSNTLQSQLGGIDTNTIVLSSSGSTSLLYHKRSHLQPKPADVEMEEVKHGSMLDPTLKSSEIQNRFDQLNSSSIYFESPSSSGIIFPKEKISSGLKESFLPKKSLLEVQKS